MQILYPSYYSKFHCIGGACEDTCCKSWSITIDKSTYFKMKKIKDPQYVETFPQKVRRTKKGQDGMYAEFVLREDGHCPFFTDRRMCGLQEKYGHQFLCLTCQVYPRKPVQVMPNSMEVSLMMSCPEAVRVALYNPEPITFQLAEQLEGQKPLQQMAARPPMNKDEGVDEAFVWGVREVCIDILQSRNLPLTDRIFAVGMLLKKLEELLETGTADGYERVLATYLQAVKAGEFAGRLDEVPYAEDMHILMKQVLFNTAVQRTLQAGVKDQNIFQQFLWEYTRAEGTQSADEHGSINMNFRNDAEFLRKFNTFVDGRVQGRWQEFLSEKEYVLENYFVNYVFCMAFPCTYYKDLKLYHHIMILAEQYAMFRMLLCVNAGEDGEITEELLTQVITSMAVNSSHNQEAKRISSAYRQKELSSIAHMAYLLR